MTDMRNEDIITILQKCKRLLLKHHYEYLYVNEPDTSDEGDRFTGV